MVQKSGGEEDLSAKHMFDRIGAEVQQKVHDAALQYNSQLLGHLSQATFREGYKIERTDAKLCKLNYKYHTNVTIGGDKEYPCRGKDTVRFSDTKGGECATSKIEGNVGKKTNNGKECGACAPYRRLHLCDRNLEHIDPEKITSTHNLLVDVLLGAQYEGQSIRTQYQQKKDDYKSGLCTALARSFADIGDIIRGKDLYLGNDKENDKLEQNLKNLFKKLYEELRKKKTNGEIEERYGQDSPNFYKLREDWWDANRQEIWNSIICDVPEDAKYFRESSSNKGGTYEKCRCAIGNVLTNFDYVPQYLRWFDEWAEEFCRKKKKFLDIVKTNCRNYAQNLYCSRNGYDCTETIYNVGKLVIGVDCPKCSVACGLYESWIDNQKKEFLKQKEKYAKEILGNGRQRQRRSTTSNYKGYDKQFYEIFRSTYNDVNEFLKLLNNEEVCKKIKDEKEKINFTEKVEDDKNKNDEGTFYHSKYCQPCPVCGVIKEDNGNFRVRTHDEQECQKREQESRNTNRTTEIHFLFNDEKGKDIMKKLNAFCYASDSDNNKKKGIEDWKCFHNDDTDNKCEMQNNGTNVESHPKIMKFIDFFNFWVGHLLNDAIGWRKEISKCITESSLKKCDNRCNRHCKCFPKWVKQKQVEWKQIKEHYKYETGFKGVFTPYRTLEMNLELYYFPIIQEAYGGLKSLQEMRKLIKDKEEKKGKDNTENLDAIDVLLDHEEEDAEKCKKIHNDKKCNKAPKPPGAGARAETHDPSRPAPPGTTGSAGGEESEEEDDEEEEEGTEEEGDPAVKDKDGEEEDEAKKQEEGSRPQEPVKEDKLDVCETVEQALTGDNNLDDACRQKYSGNNSRLGWKCVTPTGSGSTATSEGSSGNGDRSPRVARSADRAPSDSNQGSICVPPRRRKLYIGGLTKWANNSGNDTVVSGESQASESPPASPSATASGSPNGDALLTAFVESAAIETFFLWDRYKKEKKPPATQDGARLELLNGSLEDSVEQTPEQQLQQGIIPDEFKRQMFYTLGDYRDICVGNTDIVVGDEKEKEKMKQILEKIKEHINNGSKPSDLQEKNSGQPITRETLWETFAPSIWNGMICALTYKDNSETGPKGKAPKQNKDLKEKLWDNDGNKPKNGNDYNSVTLKDENSGAQPNQTPSTTSDNTPLTQFVVRPPYFRYLEEWGETFCRERRKRLRKIRGECTKDGGKTKKCSGDGEYCEEIFSKKYNVLQDLSWSCAKPCRLYKTWIEKKRTEFEEQKKAYGDQKQNCKEESKGAQSNKDSNGVCGTLEKTCNTAKDFLQKLGPCSKNNSGDDKKGEDEIKFDDDKTFQHTNLCDPCSKFNVNCKENGNCTDVQGNTCTGTTVITAENFKDNIDCKDVVMRVSDNDTNKNGFGDLKAACEHAGIFKGIKENKWSCRNVCGYVVCKPENVNVQKEIGEKHIITIRALIERWVEYFFEDYNKIKHKISQCTKTDQGSTCQNKCQNKCKCVGEWIKLKKDEWKKIKERFNEQYKSEDSLDTFPVRSVLETFLVQIGAAKEKENIIKLSKFDGSKGCCVSPNSEKSKDEDAIDCMIKKLEENAKTCEQKHTPSGDQTKQTCENSHPEPEEPLEEENPVTQPNICPQLPEEPDEKCGDKEEEEEKEKEKTNKVDEKTADEPPLPPPSAPGPPPAAPPSSPASPAAPKQRPQPTQPYLPPALKNAMLSSTIMWSIGISFAAFTYFYLK
ncbi:hypothetical protein PFMC_05899, partial [Plasmodium falciparum CAMP/Malaysia]